MPKRLASGLVCLLLALCATRAAGRPYTIDDMLGLEVYGEIAFQPDGGNLVVEKLGPYDSAPAFPFGYFSRRLTSHLFVRAVAGSGSLLPLFAQDPDAGYWMGGFSPNGSRLVVFRLDPTALRIGIVDMATSVVRWLPDHPDLPLGHPDPIWIDNDHLLLATTADDRLPGILDFSGRTQRDLPSLWARAIAGKVPSATAIGSGAYLGVRSTVPAGALMLVDLASGRRRPLYAGQIDDIALSRDGQAVALVSPGTDIQPRASRLVGDDTASRRETLHLINIANGAEHMSCAECDVLGATLTWSPHGHHLLFFARKVGEEWEAGQLYRVDDLGPARAILPDSVRPAVRGTGGGTEFVDAAWAGSTPLILAYPTGGQGDHWYRLVGSPVVRALVIRGALPHLLSAGGHRLLTTDGTTLVETSLQTSSRTAMGQDLLRTGVVSSDPLRLGARRILSGAVPAVTLGTSGDSTRIGAVAAGRIVGPGLLDDKDGVLRAVTTDGRLAVSYRRDAHGVGSLWLLAPAGAVQIDRINCGLANVEPARVMRLDAGTQADKQYHWLFLPPVLPAGAKPPLVVIPYPGTVFRPDAPPDQNPARFQAVLGAQLLAAQGYVVLFPSMKRVPGNREPMAGILRSVDAAVDAAIGTGTIDPDRMAIWGHSFGGYAALAVAGESKRYRAIIASAAPANLLSDYGKMTTSTKIRLEDGLNLSNAYGWSEAGQGGLGAAPWQDPGLYVRNSPLFGVSQITTPVLLIQGDIDYVSVMQSEQMFSALYRLDKDALLLRYWGEDHVPESPANIRDLYSHVLAFLAKAMPPADAARSQSNHDHARAQASSAR